MLNSQKNTHHRGSRKSIKHRTDSEPIVDDDELCVLEALAIAKAPFDQRRLQAGHDRIMAEMRAEIALERKQKMQIVPDNPNVIVALDIMWSPNCVADSAIFRNAHFQNRVLNYDPQDWQSISSSNAMQTQEQVACVIGFAEIDSLFDQLDASAGR
ncbi:hypothetical protein HK100_005554 [Physocladia obscura]|uniref:Uncharacterized protein n=1 Tax=Physocladia obscura TaxID=109957 RepID=A0AAD5ST00_9FUNG|nr:hypothetical protein HK100_005554 [Physocladia obscura]